MGLYLQVCAGLLIAVVLILTLRNGSAESGMLLALGACCMGAMAAITYLEPVITFLTQLADLGGLDDELVSILLKATGIGVLTELSSLICADSGNTSLGKTLQILGSAMILWLCLPLFTMLTEALKGILGSV